MSDNYGFFESWHEQFMNSCLDGNMPIKDICSYINTQYLIYNPLYVVDYIQNRRPEKQNLIDDYYREEQMKELNLL